MTPAADWAPVLARLERYRALVLGMAAEELTYSLPMLAVPPTAGDPLAQHQRQMYATVERLHDALQAVQLSEQLLVHEFTWGAQVLPRWGVRVEHVEEMIDRYIGAAGAGGAWSPAELAVLEAIRAYLRGVARAAFAASGST